MVECFLLLEPNDDLIKILSDKSNTKEYFYDNDNVDIKNVINSMFVDNKKQIVFGIYLENKLIGIIGFKKKNKTYTHIIIDKLYQNKGYAADAYDKVFNILLNNKLYVNFGLYMTSSIYETNLPSIKLFEKLGFKKKEVVHVKNNKIILFEYCLLEKRSELFEKVNNFNFLKENMTTDKYHLLAYYYCNQPFIKRVKNKKIIKKFMKNLRNYQPIYIDIDYLLNFRKYYKSNIVDKKLITQYIDSETDFYLVNMITEYFQENCRMECQRHDSNIKPIEHWKDPEKLYNIFLEIENVNIDNIYNWFYKNIRTCTYFKSTLAYSVYKYFNSKRILDISSGWGDRLVGAIGINADCYHGFDPNECVHKGYQEIIKILNVDKTKFIIKKQGFENAKLTEMYDTVFTSPPYFILEKYSDDSEQSITKYNDLNDWNNNFLYKSLRNAWNHLISGGHLAINIEDIINKKTGENTLFTEDMIHYINNNFKNCKYLGIYSFTNDLFVFRPIFVWKKL